MDDAVANKLFGNDVEVLVADVAVVLLSLLHQSNELFPHLLGASN